MFNHKNLLALLLSSKVRSLWFQRWAYSLIKIFSPNVSSNSGLVNGLAFWVQKMLSAWNTFTSLKSDILQAGLVFTQGWKISYNGHFFCYYFWLADFWKHTFSHVYMKIIKYTHGLVLITPPLCGTGNWTWALVHDSQGLYHWTRHPDHLNIWEDMLLGNSDEHILCLKHLILFLKKNWTFKITCMHLSYRTRRVEECMLCGVVVSVTLYNHQLYGEGI